MKEMKGAVVHLENTKGLKRDKDEVTRVIVHVCIVRRTGRERSCR